MPNLMPFQFNTSSIRVVTTDDGEILFVASDIAITLGYTNPPKAVRDHCKKAKSLIDIDGTNRSVQQNQELAKLDPKTKLIPESDVYRLTLRSKLESAEAFQDWLVEDVIPNIRKTGSYTAPQAKQPTPDKQTIQATREFKALLSVAKLIGLKGNQAVLSANQATQKTTGVNVVQLLGVTLESHEQQRLLTPSDIGVRLGGLSGKAVNQLLKIEGFQVDCRDAKDRLVWVLTEKGEQFARLIDTGKKNEAGAMVQQVKWFESVVDMLSKGEAA